MICRGSCWRCHVQHCMSHEPWCSYCTEVCPSFEMRSSPHYCCPSEFAGRSSVLGATLHYPVYAGARVDVNSLLLILPTGPISVVLKIDIHCEERGSFGHRRFLTTEAHELHQPGCCGVHMISPYLPLFLSSMVIHIF